MSDIRQKQIGQLQQLNEQRRKISQQAENLMVVIAQKNDQYIDNVCKLDTSRLLQAATDLDICIRQLRAIDEKAEKLHDHLYG